MAVGHLSMGWIEAGEPVIPRQNEVPLGDTPQLGHGSPWLWASVLPGTRPVVKH